MDTDITEALETLASGQPTAPALHVPGRRTLSYADLGAQIRYVRRQVGGWGVVRGDLIAGVIPPRPEMALACATFPAVATFAPLSPALTSDSYAELLTRLRPKVVILPDEIDHPIRTAARRCGVAEVDLRTDASAPAGMFTVELARQQESLSRAAPSRRDWAYVIATSGTTGRPKLVPRSHRQLALHAESLGELCRLGADDVGCHLLRMQHTHGIDAALMIPLLRGSSVVCLPEFDIEGFFTALDEYRVSWLTAVFTVYREILRRAPDFREAVARNSLRFMRVTSGLLEPDEADRIEHTFGTPLLAGYGMTEVRMIAHEPLAPRARKRRSAGVPVCSEVAVVSKAGAICSTGEVGEVVVRGPAVFDGYFDDEKATAAAFVDGWFRTGDLGRFDEDGYLYLVGRIKDLINRGGEKIAPAEIDAAIAPIPGIREVATFAIPHQSLGEEIAAAVVVDGTVAIHASDIIEQVRQRLGPKRVPRHIYFVDRLPRTDSGKVRRSELPQLVERERLDARSAGGSHIEEPGVVASAMEAALAGIWASVLKAKKVGRADDFFMLGGDSLSGARLLANIKSLFGVDLPLASLFDRAATVAGMARMIEEARARGAAREHAADSLRSGGTIPRRQPDGAAILSDTQQRMWFLAKLDPDTSSYNESRAYRLLGSIDAEALRRALRFVAGRHEILRATYSLIDDEPRQIVHADATLDLQLADLSDTPAVQQDEALQRLLLGETQRPFDLAKGPTLRLVLVRLSDREHVLLRVAHHISVDGWSAGILEQELSSAYNAFVSKREPAWAELPIQYADYAAWQREWLQSEVLEQQLGYWKAQLADLPTLALPTDRPRPAVVSDCGARALFDLPAPLLQGLKEVGRREGATLFMTLLAAFQVLLYRYSGQEDIAVGVPIAGRRRSELQGLIGFFANTLVLRGDLAGNPLFRELLARVRERALGAYTHQDVPFEKLVEELAPARDLSRNPLFQVMFALQNAPGATLALQGVQASPLALAGHTAKFDLSLAVRESDEGLHARWEYSTDLFDAATIERMARHFERLLEGIVADPQQRIGALPLLSAAERYQLLVEWNDTAADRRDGCVHELFEDQAARSPDAVAVVFEERQLTYAELNARANRVAHHLIDLGVKPEVLVGLCMERSLEMIVGLLGILKAGGAYVPLDPAYPVDRLTFMIADTQAPVLLTQQRLLSRLAQHPGQILCIDSDPPAASAARSENPPRQARPENLAYVIYTSGSTGRPKGVAIEHRSAVAFLHWVPTVFSDSELAATLFSTSICFDLSIFELFAPLSRGGAVILAQNALQLPELPAAGRVTLINTVPSAMTELMRLGAVPASVRTVNLAGEPLPGSLARSIYELRHVDQLYNLFGPTEDTTYSTYALMGRGDTEAPSIGRPIAGTRLYVLDRNGSPVPVGVPGELYIGGAGLARGYLNRPELTAERFVSDPFTTEPGARLYRTGDLVRYRPDGNLDYLGRLDEQVKV
ncbi:MAG: amino acid adenylation domain-containing protein, partial [Burkholderiales bacterium]